MQGLLNAAALFGYKLIETRQAANDFPTLTIPNISLSSLKNRPIPALNVLSLRMIIIVFLLVGAAAFVAVPATVLLVEVLVAVF